MDVIRGVAERQGVVLVGKLCLHTGHLHSLEEGRGNSGRGLRQRRHTSTRVQMVSRFLAKELIRDLLTLPPTVIPSVACSKST